MTASYVPLSGVALPDIVTPIPGPRSQSLAERLGRVESRNITCLTPVPPIFWAEARGANVRDVDGNVFIDLTAGFGVATAGHANPAVTDAISRQAALLPHALGDVDPADVKVKLLERLSEIMPQPLRVSILGNSGAEAVEAALKTAVLRTGRSGILAFRNSYHGLTYGALSVTERALFREPFEAQLFEHVRFAPFPSEEAACPAALQQIDELLDDDVGAILVEPIQGRGGIVVPCDSLLGELRKRCDGRSRVLIFDEIYTGCGRTGTWLACEQWQVIPDLVTIGKGLSGSLPISACIGTPDVMSAWPESHGEAIHTSTFLGNPVACAAALAQIDEIERGGLLGRATGLGQLITSWATQLGIPCRGRGLIQGLVMPNSETALNICRGCLEAGVLILAEGPKADVLAITPPAVITEQQLRFALTEIGAILSRVSR